MPNTATYINTLNLVCALGDSRGQIQEQIVRGQTGLALTEYATDRFQYLAAVKTPLTDVEIDKKFDSRNNRLLHTCLEPMFAVVDELIREFGRHRIGVVLGTSTSGISDAEQAIRYTNQHDSGCDDYSYHQQQMSSVTDYVVDLFDLGGPGYTISTACSSSAKALLSAAELLKLNLCDAVIAGGCDTLCQMTIEGFASLDAISTEICDPFGVRRMGTNLGEGCGIFIMTREKAAITFNGGASSSDAYHFSAPDPTGNGASAAMHLALKKAGLEPESIDYINLHGTGTVQNDQMEATAIHQIFDKLPVCGSTKPLTGHTLGAAGAVEAALLCYTLQQNGDCCLPAHVLQSEFDASLPDLELVETGKLYRHVNCCMSNSFAFGGSNSSLIFSRTV